ncbi:MAG: hypothetical protein J6U92_06135, partial [Clostridia bacterium]|nr:hypothetical protein [Clostridia bacterium]
MTLKRKIISILSISVVLIACVLLAFFIKTPVYAEYSLSSVSYKETYAIGDTLSIQSAKITYLGKEYDADAIVHFPDGTKKQLQEVTFSKSGNYIIEYRSIVDGKVLFKTVNFSVESNVFSIDGKGSVSYGSNPYFTDNIKGVNVSMSRGSVLTYNRTIDLSDNGVTSAPVLKIYATPEVTGVSEIDTLKVTLTDLYDSENYVEFRYKHQDGHIYVAGNAKGQPTSGLEGHSKLTPNTIIYDGNMCRLWQKHVVYGYSAKTSFTGLRQIVSGLTLPTFEDNFCELSVDYSTKRFYAQQPWTGISKLVIDLDEPLFFNDNLWEGFTTGEAILSVSSVGSGSNFNCFITDIDGHDLTSIKYTEKTAPIISVDTLTYDQNNLPNAIVGKNYPVFDREVVSTNADIVSDQAFVYYNYDNSSRTPVNIIDGYFKPDKAGKYTIIYKAVDSKGGETLKTLNVTAVTRTALEYQFVDAPLDKFNVGQKVKIKDVSFNNALEGYSLTTTATLKGGNAIYEIKDGSFIPLYSGKYDINYTYQDIAEKIEFSYEIVVDTSDVPVFESVPAFPRYFIKNCTYDLYKINAYDFTNGTKLVPATIYVSQDGGQDTLLSSNSYKVTANQTVEITYKATTNDNTAEIKSDVIPVIDVGYGLTGKDAALDTAKYLQSAEFTLLQKAKNNISYTVNENSAKDGVATLSAINDVYTELFNLEFTTDATANAFGQLQVLLTDCLDGEKVVTINYTPNQSGCLITVSNGKNYYSAQTESKFDGTSKFLIESNGDNLIFSNATLIIPLGKLFEGFSD